MTNHVTVYEFIVCDLYLRKKWPSWSVCFAVTQAESSVIAYFIICLKFGPLALFDKKCYNSRLAYR
jgi:hypothetical protein